VTTALETRYRRLLGILPAGYRAEWEEEMVATFLQSMATDDADDAEYLADDGRPGWSEVASVAALAVRLRIPVVRRHIGGSDSPPRFRLLGDAVRIVALLGLLVQAAFAGVSLATQLWLAGKVPGLAPPPQEWVTPLTALWPTTLVVLAFAALPAYVALVLGHWHVARVLASVALGAVVVSAVTAAVNGDPLLAGRYLALLIDALLLAALWAFHRTAPPVRRRPWLLALPVATGLAAAVFMVSARFPVTWVLLDWAALCCLAATAGIAVHLVAVAAGRARRAGAWPLALTIVAAGALGQRVVTLIESSGNIPPGQRAAFLLTGAVEVVAIVAVGLPGALRCHREWRRLPAPPVASPLART
jgi:hypothetical protein